MYWCVCIVTIYSFRFIPKLKLIAYKHQTTTTTMTIITIKNEKRIVVS